MNVKGFDPVRLPDLLLPHPYRVRRVHRETRDTFTIESEPLDGSPVTPFAPGQFNMIYVFGVGEVPISISGDPARLQTLVHTVRAVGAVTKAICSLKRGDAIGMRGPFGSPWPVEPAVRKDVVIAAGGLGLAPLRPALYHVLSNRGKYGKIAVVYGARTADDLLYRRELDKWRGHFDLQVEVTVDSAGDGWRGNVGVVTAVIPRVRFDPLHTVAMICGPEVMMHFTIIELLKHGMGEQDIFISMERNMKCGIGFCGRCQFGPELICRDGPVLRYGDIRHLLGKREI